MICFDALKFLEFTSSAVLVLVLMVGVAHIVSLILDYIEWKNGPWN
jgi:hypothetical protein